MAGPTPLRAVSPEVTSSLLTIAAASGGNPAVLTSVELDAQVATHERIGLARLAAYAEAGKGFPAERDMLSAENHQRTATHLRTIRHELFGTGSGAVPLQQAQARAAGFQLRWNAVSEGVRAPR